ncbi:MAG: isoaspartyl peptidase/L-asparaginase [Mariprofundaceae bacterium]
MSFQIIAHGGANNLEIESEERQEMCQRIVSESAIALSKGALALDVCELTIQALENEPVFDAGTGSYIQTDGTIRMDASLMTSELDLGSVLQISDVKNPISVARKILENPMHAILSGEGANNFARESGFISHDVYTDARRASYAAVTAPLQGDLTYSHLADVYVNHSASSLGTVGCVVRDHTGLIVAGTSTGGRKVCYQGRVSDSGLPGNGTYANAWAGASCTGVGEKIMRLSLARLLSFYVESGDNLNIACQKSINKLSEIHGDGGIIAISSQGEISYNHNTRYMSVAQAEG